MKALIRGIIILAFICKSALAQSPADPEVCFLNAITKQNLNTQVHTWEIRDACMKIFIQVMEKKAIPISSELITQPSLRISSYGDGYLEVTLKNNSNYNALYAIIAITSIQSGEVDKYRFIPIESDIIGPLSAGVLRAQTRITKDRVKDGAEFSAKYKWSLVNVFGYQY